jgi:hypothetical protein
MLTPTEIMALPQNARECILDLSCRLARAEAEKAELVEALDGALDVWDGAVVEECNIVGWLEIINGAKALLARLEGEVSR